MISLDKVPEIFGEFLDSRLIPNSPQHIKWLLGGMSYVFATGYTKFVPLAKTLGLVTENNEVNLNVAKGILKAAFEKQPTVEYYGFKFDKSDGDALINIMEKYNG